MSTTRFYDEVIAKLSAGLEADVLGILTDHVGAKNAISLDELAMQTLGKANSTTERQVREAIEHLRRQGVPVLSESGRAGRWLAANREELMACVTEMQTRAGNLQETIKALKSATAPFDEGRQMRQLRMWA